MADSVVKKGGVAESDAASEDVTRDTYGFTGSRNTDGEGRSPSAARREAERVLNGEEPSPANRRED